MLPHRCMSLVSCSTASHMYSQYRQAPAPLHVLWRLYACPQPSRLVTSCEFLRAPARRTQPCGPWSSSRRPAAVAHRVRAPARHVQPHGSRRSTWRSWTRTCARGCGSARPSLRAVRRPLLTVRTSSGSARRSWIAPRIIGTSRGVHSRGGPLLSVG